MEEDALRLAGESICPSRRSAANTEPFTSHHWINDIADPKGLTGEQVHPLNETHAHMLTTSKPHILHF